MTLADTLLDLRRVQLHSVTSDPFCDHLFCIVLSTVPDTLYPSLVERLHVYKTLFYLRFISGTC